MKVLILNTDYPDFLEWLYTKHRSLEQQTYDEQMRTRVESLFGVADFYSSNLRKLGHEAYDIHANNEWMQKAWAREHGINMGSVKPLLQRLLRRSERQPVWFHEVLSAQIRHYRPDVLLNQDIFNISADFLYTMKPFVRLLVGQHAATPLPEHCDLHCYDLVISSFLPTVDEIRRRRVKAELHRLAFEPRVLSQLKPGSVVHDITFIGSLFGIHRSRIALLEELCGAFPQIKIWGPAVHQLPPASEIRKRYVGPAWGIEMYQILANSKLTVNHHGDVPPYANNMRLYEATGVGTLLITDWKVNLKEMLEPGHEVVTYRSPEECAEKVQYYLEHESERETIARAGQQRTLKEHTYEQRMNELVEIIERYMR